MIRLLFLLFGFFVCTYAANDESIYYVDAKNTNTFDESAYQKPSAEQNSTKAETNVSMEQNTTKAEANISMEQNSTKTPYSDEADLYIDLDSNETNTTEANRTSLSDDPLFHAQRDEGMSFHDAINKAIENSYKIDAVMEQVLQSKMKKEEAFAGHLPVINFTGDGGYEARQVRKDDNNPGNFSSLTTYQKYRKVDLYLTITQNLWNGGAIQDAINKEKANLNATLYNYREKLEDLVAQTAKAYFEVVYAEIALKIAKKNMKSYLKILNIVQTKEKNGAATKGDVNFIQANVDNAKIDLVQREKAVVDAKANYTYLLQTTSEAELPYEIETPLYINDLNTSLQEAEQHNAKLQKQKSYIDASRYDFLSTKGSFHPKIDLAINGESRNEFNVGLGKREKANALLLFNYNLYRGGKDEARAIRLLSKMREQKYLFQDIRRKLVYDVTVLNQSVLSLHDSLALKEREVLSSREVVKSYWIAFGHGTQDLQALQLAQINLNRAEQAYARYKKELILSNIELMQKTGVLLEFLEVAFKKDASEFKDSSHILYNYYNLEQ